ncbi:hypothetical protein [Microcoleus anatoxicus]|uniref:hypothetical protein n=1 Tax=Microcoleus anatoxicus TaxID=2705319 RepID=UPI0030C9A0E0
MMKRIDKLRLALEQYSDRTPKDERLCKLIIAICSESRDNPQRRKLVDRLLRQLQLLPKISKVSHPYYLEALNKTWQWLDNHLHEFNPRRSPIQASLTTWVNAHLRYRIHDLYATKSQKVLSLDLDALERSGFYNDCLDGLDIEIERIERQEKQALAWTIAQYIDRDPEQKLRRCHPKNRPDCNCQIIAQKLFFQQSPEKMAAIARQLNIKTQTIYSFWKRTGLSKLQGIGRHFAQKNSDFMSG